MDEVVYSEASYADKKAILELVREAGLTKSTALWTRIMSGTYYVAKVDGTVVGGSGFTSDGRHPAKTMFLVVASDYQSKGIGEKLQTMRMEGAIKLGCSSMRTLAPTDKVADWYVSKFGYVKSTRKTPPYIELLVDLNGWKQ